MVILPNTDEGRAMDVAERLRTQISQKTLALANQNKIKITISNGIAIFDPKNEIDLIHSVLADKYYQQADFAMYLAKQKGRNQTRVWKAT